MDKKLLDFINQKINFWQVASYDDYFSGYIDGLLEVKKFIEEMETKGEDE